MSIITARSCGHKGTAEIIPRIALFLSGNRPVGYFVKPLGIEYGDHHQSASGNKLPVGADKHQIHTVGNHPHHQSTQKYADRQTLPARQRHAADGAGRNGDGGIAAGRRRCGGTDAGSRENTGQCRESRSDDISGKTDSLYIDTRVVCGLIVAADGIDLSAIGSLATKNIWKSWNEARFPLSLSTAIPPILPIPLLPPKTKKR